ncbi:MAG: hypothetical protein IJV12_00375 [Acidaminococcaceae bacterium]|nr:hypothetical protein [Acidaminococcaceae bacterium]
METKNLEALAGLRELGEKYAEELCRYGKAEIARAVSKNKDPLTPLAAKILEDIKKCQGITYAEAYAALDLVAQRLELESKFIQVGEPEI